MRDRITLRLPDRCGYCGRELAMDEAAVRVTVASTRLIRCVPCAGPVPEGQPLRLVSDRSDVATRVSDLAARFTRRRDWKHEQAGDR